MLRSKLMAHFFRLRFSLLLLNTVQGSRIDGDTEHGTPMHRVLMTQRDYIQFLRWELPVPEIQEFTFCLWFVSTNLTLANSIFSYSRDESERLVSSWISAGGRQIHLEIGSIDVFSVPVNIQENRWYHLCESWDNRDGQYALWLQGQLVMEGFAKKTRRYMIPAKGDVVVGQEYTDFDKGLEEGLEGSVLGFNLLLRSAFESPPLLGRQLFFPEMSSRESPGGYLVRTTFQNCRLGRGSPFIEPKLLISWTRTPVKIFGGAIVKNVRGDCGHFT